MMRCLVASAILALGMGSAMCAFAEDGIEGLPRPHYRREPSDPAWLSYAAQFHGHLGPWATAGIRAGMAARGALDAHGYFDIDVVVEGPLVKPPQSCFLDGLQVSTGATLGKRNLHWVQRKALVIRATNTKTGRVAELRPTPKLLEMLGSFQPAPPAGGGGQSRQPEDCSPEAAEKIARQLALMPEKEIFTVTLTKP